MILKYCLFGLAEKLRRSRGTYTDAQVARCSQLGGQFGRNLSKLFCGAIGSEKDHFVRNCESVDKTDVAHFLETYSQDRLWSFIPGRQHDGFANIKHEWKFKNGAKFAAKMASLSQSLDCWRTFAE